MEKVEVSVIISTYNAFEWLKKTLAGYEVQTFRNFEIIIADDGSKEEIKFEIEKYISQSTLFISHVWHEDIGFRKTIILNKALAKCRAPYIIMTDGDCIPRKDFVEAHVKNRKKGYFLSGGYFKLPLNISKVITIEDIQNQKCFNVSWLKKRDLKTSFIKNLKISASGIGAELLNKVTPTKATWNGHNSSAYKTDILKVNGFDERMEYGAEDREMGVRLYNLGLKSRKIRYSAICLHLEHTRGYVNKEALEKNRVIFLESLRQKKIWSQDGIEKHLDTTK